MGLAPGGSLRRDEVNEGSHGRRGAVGGRSLFAEVGARRRASVAHAILCKKNQASGQEGAHEAGEENGGSRGWRGPSQSPEKDVDGGGDDELRRAIGAAWRRDDGERVGEMDEGEEE